MSPKTIHRSMAARNPTIMKIKIPTNLIPMAPVIRTPTEQSHRHHQTENGLQRENISSSSFCIFNNLL